MNPEVDLYIKNYKGVGKDIFEEIRFFILGSHPNILEFYKWKVPFYELDGPLGYITSNKKYLVFSFARGHLLEEFFPQLNGEQKLVRHFEIQNLDDGTLFELGEILEKAIEINLNLKNKKWLINT